LEYRLVRTDSLEQTGVASMLNLYLSIAGERDWMCQAENIAW
jgi:hypothetical protein